MRSFDKGILSIKEMQVIKFMLMQLSRPHTAMAMRIAVSTVATHFKNIHNKTQTHDPVELTIWAFTNGFSINPETHLVFYNGKVL